MKNSFSLQTILVSALLLTLFAVIGVALVAFTFDHTRERIAANERDALLRNLHAIIAPDAHDNDLFSDTIEVTDPQLLGTHEAVTVYRARMQGTPVAVVLTAIAPNGYSGAIKLLVGIYHDGTVAGVRVLGHRETPGLGDAIEAERSDWILDFRQRSLSNPGHEGWKVRRDGGVFDQFTGATITPRAVVKAVHNSLIYYQRHRDTLFAPAATASASRSMKQPVEQVIEHSIEHSIVQQPQ